MKKLLTALSGLLFVVGIILAAGGCEAECSGTIIGGCACVAACMLIANACDDTCYIDESEVDDNEND